jgi:hypothetical protein
VHFSAVAIGATVSGHGWPRRVAILTGRQIMMWRKDNSETETAVDGGWPVSTVALPPYGCRTATILLRADNDLDD